MLVAVESFCGAGGMSVGLKQAGFEVLYAFDNDEYAVSTYRNNVGDHVEQQDIRKLDAAYIRGKIGNRRLDLFSGGPPCQGFSKQRRLAHIVNDERNQLVRDYFNLVSELNPRAFIFENVEIFGQLRGRDFLDFADSVLNNAYELNRFFVSAADFGLAQTRGRFIMIGIAREEKWHLPILSRTLARKTVKDAIGDLPPPPEDYSDHPDFPHHSKARISEMNERRIAFVREGGGWRDIPYDLRLDCHKSVDSSKGGWPDVYGRLSWTGTCPTITSGFDNFSRGRFAHPKENRALTLREGARLQGFPDTFVFSGTRHDIRKQIGNAVPPPLAKAAGEAVKRVLQRESLFPVNPLLPEEYGIGENMVNAA